MLLLAFMFDRQFSGKDYDLSSVPLLLTYQKNRLLQKLSEVGDNGYLDGLFSPKSKERNTPIVFDLRLYHFGSNCTLEAKVLEHEDPMSGRTAKLSSKHSLIQCNTKKWHVEITAYGTEKLTSDFLTLIIQKGNCMTMFIF